MGTKTLKFTLKVNVVCDWDEGRPDATALREAIDDALNELLLEAIDGQTLDDIYCLAMRDDADDIAVTATIDVQGAS